MNFIDIILLIPLLWGLYKGFLNGIIKEATSLVALFLGIYGAASVLEKAKNILSKNILLEEPILSITAFSISFFIIILIVRATGSIVDRLIKIASLNIINRIAGAFFGIIKTTLIISTLLIFINKADEYLKVIPKKEKKESILYQPFSQIAKTIFLDGKQGKEIFHDLWNKIKTNSL